MIYIVLGLIGAVMGSFYLYGRGDFLLGGIIGLLAAAAINQRNGLIALKKRLAAMETQISGLLSGEKYAGPTTSAEATDPAHAATAGPGGRGRTSVPGKKPNRVPAFETPPVPTLFPESADEIPSL